MSEREDFVAAVNKAPHDGVLRLVFADYLDERGDPLGAELRKCAASTAGLCCNEVIEPHSCPYASDVHGDHETTCMCCPGCTARCAEDI